MSTGLPLEMAVIQHVVFYKRDELTTDLICCEILMASGQTLWFHEEMPNWNDVVAQIELLEGFPQDWRSHVIQPPFAECRFMAYEKRAQ
ncbi:hypothetical protein [Novosphingobium taihuense]|uniref:Uncharacterized protein n=1 Tax=Novosphingobium taihuense TaxID=260085 RepID=A0A7W7AEL1_9SPHN|nr:hypothetical protein [Novosphingobium taihuense]MBB4615610.1 hypothetical protein [Novosphingobium taihuense]TWH82900.1 hypothetical protein IQ25_03181 [Novosphingobium taihuense]